MLTWRVLSKIPNVVMLGSVVLGGIYWVTQRSEEVARAEGARGDGPGAGESHGKGVRNR